MDKQNTATNIILRKIANTIIANLENTTGIGLFEGKMGICIFLYEYSRLSGHSTYEKIASDLLDDVFRNLNPTMSTNITNGLAGIGCGLIRLVHKGFVECDSSDLLDDVDAALFTNIRKSLMREKMMPKGIFPSGVYLIHRLRYFPNAKNGEWADRTIAEIEKYVGECLKFGAIPTVSSLNSIIFVCNNLYSCNAVNKMQYRKITELLTELVDISLKDKKYDASDIIMLENINTNHKPITPTGTGFNKNKFDTWYNCCWQSWLYDIYTEFSGTRHDICSYLNDKMMNVFYDLNTANSHLAAAGLWIINKHYVSLLKQRNDEAYR